MKESEFQKQFLRKVKDILGDKCRYIKNDANYIQGFPDWTVFYGDKYAILEMKADVNSRKQPNQEYYINKFSEEGGFARFVYPQNEKEVLDDLVRYFGK